MPKILLITSVVMLGFSCVTPTQELSRVAIFDIRLEKEIQPPEFYDRLKNSGIVVLAEIHEDQNTQMTEAEILRGTMLHAGDKLKGFSVGMEYLQEADDALIQNEFSRYRIGEITFSEFRKKIPSLETSKTYEPVFATIKQFHGELVGVNRSADERRSIVLSGLAQAKGDLIPAQFSLGSREYWDRFKRNLSSSHELSSGLLSRYFEAHCLSDDVMANNLIRRSRYPLRFLIVGNFHADYRQGVVARLEKRAPSEKVTVVRIVNNNRLAGFRVEDLDHTHYGKISDFLIVVNPERGS